ncbi:MAG: hypothetical protein U1F83_11130 [Verrucomicrobiota bacterium]
MNKKVKENSQLLNAVNHLNECSWPYTKTFLLAGIPTVVVLMLLTANGISFSADQRKLLVGCIVTLAMVGSVAWMWILPRKDFLIVHQRGIRWQIWLSKWNTLPSKGTICLEDLKEFSYSSSWGEPQGLQISPSATAPEKVTALVMFLALDTNALEIVDGNGNRRIIENFFIRFERADLERLLNYVSERAPQLVHRIE